MGLVSRSRSTVARAKWLIWFDLFQITRDGRIVDEGIIRVNNARKEHKARSKGVLATSIINRAIEIEVA